MLEEADKRVGQSKAHGVQGSRAILSEHCYAEKWFTDLTFRKAVITLASYYCARGNCSRGRDFLQQIIEDHRHDEETRFILLAFLNDCLCSR